MMKCFFSSVISFLKDYRFFRFSSPLGIFIINPSLVSSVLGRDFVELSKFSLFFARAPHSLLYHVQSPNVSHGKLS